MANTSIAVAVSHAVSFLTRRLVTSYPAATIVKLQLVLEANLTALYAPTWTPQEPLRGSGRRCLSLSPDCLPPRAIYSACLASGVQWFDWIAHLGGQEFDFFVDPGCVSIRVGNGDQLITVWADEIPSAAPLRAQFDDSCIRASIKRRADQKTYAQHLLELDASEDDQLFSMITNEVNAPTTWVSSASRLPVRSTSPLSSISSISSSSSSSTISTHSRSSSRASNSSFGSSDSSSSTEKRSSRRSKKNNVFVDTSKKEVTPYDGGKTTVLTGGVMLGGSASGRSKKNSNNNWRA